jgi:hypothetical protein
VPLFGGTPLGIPAGFRLEGIAERAGTVELRYARA